MRLRMRAMRMEIEMPTKDAVKELPELTGYSGNMRLLATRYRQGGRTVFGLHMTPRQIVDLIPAPDVEATSPGNRKIRPAHATAFGKYFQENQDWVSPGILLRIAEPFDFEQLYEIEGTQFGMISFPLSAARDMHISDGQHRILGWHRSLQKIADDLERAANTKQKARRNDPDSAAIKEMDALIAELTAQRKRAENERVPVEVIVEPDLRKARQMFVDIAENAIGITSSVRSVFDMRKVINRSLELVMDHPLLSGRVEVESDRISPTSPNLVSAKQLVDVVRSAKMGIGGRIGKVLERQLSEADIAREAKNFFDIASASFAPLQALMLAQVTAETLRKTNLMSSVVMLRVMAGLYHELRNNHSWTDEMIGDFYRKLDAHMAGPVYPGSIWLKNINDGIFADGSMGPSARNQDVKVLYEKLLEAALDDPEWLNAPPAPRPEPVSDELPVDVSEEEADAILRPETAAARKKRTPRKS